MPRSIFGTRSFEATVFSDGPVVWLRNTTTQRFELLSPLTGLPTEEIDAHAGGFAPAGYGLDGGLILRPSFDFVTRTNSFVADWIDDSIEDPVPTFAPLVDDINREDLIVSAGNQLVIAAETLSFPADRDEVDVTLSVEMLLPGAVSSVTVLSDLSVNDNNRYALILRGFRASALPICASPHLLRPNGSRRRNWRCSTLPARFCRAEI